MAHGALKDLLIRASALLGLSKAGAGADTPQHDRPIPHRPRPMEAAIHRIETVVEGRREQLRTHRERRDGVIDR